MEELRIVVRGNIYVMRDGQLWCICKHGQSEYKKHLVNLKQIVKNTTKLMIFATSLWSVLDATGLFDIMF